MKIQKNEGITLIALVITIIVLLILAGVGINALTGEKSVINEAKDAKSATERAQLEEEMEILSIKVIGNGVSTGTEMSTYVENNLPGADIYKTTDTYVRFDYNGEDIVLHDDGDVTVIEKVEPENPEDWEFDPETGTIRLLSGISYKDGEGKTYEIVVPNYFNGVKVKKITENSYNESGFSISKLVISDGIEILDKTFGGVHDIYLSNTLKEITKAEAINCSYMDKIIIPKSVDTIVERAIDPLDYGAKIYCEISESEKPNGWDENWTTVESSKIIWGYGQ